MIDKSVKTGRSDPGRDPRMTRRDLFVGVGRVAVAGASVSSLALLGACATAEPEPWADGTFWADGTGWIE